MTKTEMIQAITNYVLNAYFSLLANGADKVNFLMICADGHDGKDFTNLRLKGVNPENGYLTIFTIEDFKNFCIKTNAIKLKTDSKKSKKTTAGKGKAEIRISNTAFFNVVADLGVQTYQINLDSMRNKTNQTNNGNAFECYLQRGYKQIEKYEDYKPDNVRFDKNGDIVTKTGLRIQAKTNRCSLAYLSTLNKLYPMSEEVKQYCEKCGFPL